MIKKTQYKKKTEHKYAEKKGKKNSIENKDGFAPYSDT